MTIDYEDIILLVETMVHSLLSESGMAIPPVDPFVIAKKLKVPCTESIIEGRRGQNLVLKGQLLIDINKDDRYERKCFTLAHELIEVLLPARFKDKDERHEIAVIGAPYLLMPTEWFRQACRETHFNILKLKKIFDTASNEAIALHTLSIAPAVVTVIDDKKVTNRQSNISGIAGKKLMPIEKEVADAVCLGNRKVHMKNENCEVTGYPLFDERIKRIILRTTLLDYPD